MSDSMSGPVYDLAVEHGQGKHRFAVVGCLVCEAEDRIPEPTYSIESLHPYATYAAITHPYPANMINDIHDRLIQSLRTQGATERQISQAKIETREDHGRTVVMASVPAMDEAYLIRSANR